MAGPTRSNNVTTTAWDGVTHAGNGYDSAGTAGFIPEIWSGKMRENFYNATVFGDIANTDHEGEIKGYGDNVVIRTIPTMTINDYEIGQKLDYEQPTSPSVELAIDRAKSFAFQCDDVEAMQMDINQMDVWSKASGEQMKVTIDTDVLANIYADAAAENSGATAGKISGDINLGATAADGSAAIQLTKTTVIDYIIQHNLCLDEYNCPEDGRFMVLPAWACATIKQSDLKDASITGDATSPLRNGRVGVIDRTTIYSSNSIAHATETAVEVYHVIAGHKKATTFASQMVKMETLPNPYSFGNLVRGLNVYGFKVVDPTLLTHGVIKK